MTREERKQRRRSRIRSIVMGIITAIVLIAAMGSFLTAWAQPETVSGQEYLQSIGASNQARAEMADVWG